MRRPGTVPPRQQCTQGKGLPPDEGAPDNASNPSAPTEALERRAGAERLFDVPRFLHRDWVTFCLCKDVRDIDSRVGRDWGLRNTIRYVLRNVDSGRREEISRDDKEASEAGSHSSSVEARRPH